MQNDWDATIFGGFTFKDGVSDSEKERIAMEIRSIGRMDFLWWEEALQEYQFHSKASQFIHRINEIKKFIEEHSDLFKGFEYTIWETWGTPDVRGKQQEIRR